MYILSKHLYPKKFFQKFFRKNYYRQIGLHFLREFKRISLENSLNLKESSVKKYEKLL